VKPKGTSPNNQNISAHNARMSQRIFLGELLWVVDKGVEKRGITRGIGG
jgi:hypothetical protein